ncbi:hypothetical protein [Micromonospora sp. DT231]|uniref:hypothetical protein n=1 Tax=Micromonospora sp. DT231 TaxID=3416526 RepID=UPI003CF6936F
MADFEANVDEILTCRTRLADIQQRAAAIADLAEDANPEWYIWGALGAPFAALYWRFAGEFYEHLGLMGEALTDRVEALDCTAEAYRRTEQDIDERMRRLHQRLAEGHPE